MIRDFYTIALYQGPIAESADPRGFCFLDDKIVRDLKTYNERVFDFSSREETPSWMADGEPFEKSCSYVSRPPEWTNVVSESVYVVFSEVSYVVVTRTDDSRPEEDEESEEELDDEQKQESKDEEDEGQNRWRKPALS